MMGEAEKTTAGSVLQGAHLAPAAEIAPMQPSAKAGGALGVQEEEQARRKAAQRARKVRLASNFGLRHDLLARLRCLMPLGHLHGKVGEGG